ncbi:MAG: helix-turn-helix domain-containing protein [Kiritimatiellaeota bacterium]|nr:helix-turn-helix domain-containing protein [Kiritimatiellota bacterium]
MSNSPAPKRRERIPRAQVVRHIRNLFGVTQVRLAAAMGTSVKTIQSYEQGWRRVPTRALIQLLVLLAIHRRREIDTVPCWEIRNCSPEDREDCANFTVGDGQLCWFVSAGKCRCGLAQGDSDVNDDLLPCMACEVIRRLLRSDNTGNGATGPKRPGNKNTRETGTGRGVDDSAVK